MLAKSKRDYRRVPLQIAERYAKGYRTVSLLNKQLIHLTEPEPYARPLCDRSGETWDRELYADELGQLRDPMCKQCVDIAERKRMAAERQGR